MLFIMWTLTFSGHFWQIAPFYQYPIYNQPGDKTCYEQTFGSQYLYFLNFVKFSLHVPLTIPLLLALLLSCISPNDNSTVVSFTP